MKNERTNERTNEQTNIQANKQTNKQANKQCNKLTNKFYSGTSLIKIKTAKENKPTVKNKHNIRIAQYSKC